MRILEKKINERVNEEKRKLSIIKLLEGVFLGVSLGMMLGTLLAPKSGKETIKDIKESGEKVKDEIVSKVKS
ncbi:MAG: YtxH domain-containing protein [Bacillota bacterium]